MQGPIMMHPTVTMHHDTMSSIIVFGLKGCGKTRVLRKIFGDSVSGLNDEDTDCYASKPSPAGFVYATNQSTARCETDNHYYQSSCSGCVLHTRILNQKLKAGQCTAADGECVRQRAQVYTNVETCIFQSVMVHELIIDTHKSLNCKFLDQEIAAKIYSKTSGNINLILFVMKKGRFTLEDEKIFNEFLGLFGQDLMEVCAMVITHCDHSSSFEKENVIQKFQSSNLTKRYARLAMKGIFASGIPDTADDTDKLKKLVAEATENRKIVLPLVRETSHETGTTSFWNHCFEIGYNFLNCCFEIGTSFWNRCFGSLWHYGESGLYFVKRLVFGTLSWATWGVYKIVYIILKIFETILNFVFLD